MLLKITSPTARNDASIRLCEVWNKPKQSLVSSRSSSMLSFKAPKITDLGFEKGVLEVSVLVYHLACLYTVSANTKTNRRLLENLL
jgi:hypothetical protein